jgi:hypothetical protein
MNPEKPDPIKIVVSGPVGSGKTTLIQTLSSTEVVSTDELASEDIGKPMTTVAMDFGVLELEDQDIFLFGTPGQDRFDYMWEILSEGCFGLILLIPADQPGQMVQVRRIYDVILSVSDIPVLLVLTRTDLGQVWEREDVQDYFDVPDDAIMEVDPRRVENALDALLELVEIYIQRGSPEDDATAQAI